MKKSYQYVLSLEEQEMYDVYMSLPPDDEKVLRLVGEEGKEVAKQ